MRKQLAVYLVLLAIVDVVLPVPILALLLGWVLWKRPDWFLTWVHGVYRGSGFGDAPAAADRSTESADAGDAS